MQLMIRIKEGTLSLVKSRVYIRIFRIPKLYLGIYSKEKEMQQYQGQNNPTRVSRTDFVTQTSVLGPTTLGTATIFPRCSGTFEVRVVANAFVGQPNEFSFFVKGGYGLPMAEGGRIYYNNAGIAPRNCTIVSEVIDKPSYITTFTITTSIVPLDGKTWTFTFCTYQSVNSTIRCFPELPSDTVSISIVKTVSQDGWY